MSDCGQDRIDATLVRKSSSTAELIQGDTSNAACPSTRFCLSDRARRDPAGLSARPERRRVQRPTVRRDADRNRSCERDHRSSARQRNPGHAAPAAGTYSIEVHDETSSHNFHLSGARRQSVDDGRVRRNRHLVGHGLRRAPTRSSATRTATSCAAPSRSAPGRPASSASAAATEHATSSPSSGLATTSASGTRTASSVNGRTLPAGTYTIDVYDYSNIHNFELELEDWENETDE